MQFHARTAPKRRTHIPMADTGRSAARLTAIAALVMSLASCGWLPSGTPDTANADTDESTPSAANASTPITETTAKPTSAAISKPAANDTPAATATPSATPTEATASSPSTTPVVAKNWVETVVDDMSLFHDGPCAVLEALPGWGSGAMWPMAKSRPWGWQYAIPWTHVIADTSSSNGNGYPWRVSGPYTGNQAPNTRVQQRDLQMWWLLSDGSWVLGTHNNRMEPVMYPLHWTEGTAGYGTDVWRDESGNGGGVSMRAIGREQYSKHLWHTWAAPHLVPNNAVGAVTVFFMRLTLDNPSGPDDRANARILAAGAGDWYKNTATLSSPKVGGDPNDPNVNLTDMGFARLKYVTRDWQVFGWTSLSASQLRSNPPPIRGL